MKRIRTGGFLTRHLFNSPQRNVATCPFGDALGWFMASEAGAEDAEALTREVALYDQEEDAIDAFMGSASSFSATESEPTTTGFDSQGDGAGASQRSASSPEQRDESSQDRSSGHQAHDTSTSDGAIAFNQTNDSDATFGFVFPNQSNVLFGQHFTRSVSERQSPASQQQQQQQERHEAKTQRENDEFRQLMAESEPRDEVRSKLPHDHRQQPAHESFQDTGAPNTSLRPHNPSMLDPDSNFSYLPPESPNQQQILSISHDTQTSSASSSTQPGSAPPASKSQPPPSPSSAPTTTPAGQKRPQSPSVEQPFSWNDILRVQNMIERCLQQYLSKSEILVALQEQAQVAPEFTNVVWQKLKEQNPSFFRAYSVQLQLKDQILAFNYLVTQQKEMMAMKGDRGALSLSSTLSADSRVFLGQNAPSFSQTAQQIGGYLSGPPTTKTSTLNQFSMPPPPLPLPSPIKTDLDTHAFFT